MQAILTNFNLYELLSGLSMICKQIFSFSNMTIMHGQILNNMTNAFKVGSR